MAKQRVFEVEDTTDELILEEMKKQTELLEEILRAVSRSQISPSG